MFTIFQWEELYDTKPDDDYEDPADVSAIKEAKDNMGDYKLKTAQDYVVPDHLRMNVDKARGRLLILKDLVCITPCSWVILHAFFRLGDFFKRNIFKRNTFKLVQCLGSIYLLNVYSTLETLCGPRHGKTCIRGF